MPVIEVVLSIKLDGVEIFKAPIRRRMEVDDTSGPFTSQMPANTTYVALNPPALAEVDMLLLQPDKQTVIRLDTQADKGIVLRPSGLLLLLDCYILGGISLFNNNLDIIVRGIIAGTGGPGIPAPVGPGQWVAYSQLGDPYPFRVVA